MKKLGYLNKIKNKISIMLFDRRKALKYIFFDKLYSKFILNKNKLPKFLENFDQDGFVKVTPDYRKEIDDLIESLKIDENSKTTPPFFFKIDNEIKIKVFSILEKINKQYIVNLKKYFNSDILPAYICLRRNTHYEKENLNQELFNDNFHNDAYLLTHFKMFINLNDVKEQNGPMKIVAKTKTKSFLKLIGYNDRQNYNDGGDNISYSNIGKTGDCLIFDPTNCFHKAGMPDKNYKRDYLIITYVCLPSKKNLIDKMSQTDIYKYKNNYLLSLSKPTHLMQTIKLLFSFYKEKFN